MTRKSNTAVLHVCEGTLARSIGDNVRVARESLSWTLAHAAQRLALSEAQLQQVEAGKRLPGLYVFLKLLTVYELDADELLGWRATNQPLDKVTAVIPLGAVPQAVGMAVLNARCSLGLSRTHVAARLGITRDELGHIEQWDTYPDLLLLARLVEEFDLCADALLRQPASHSTPETEQA